MQRLNEALAVESELVTYTNKKGMRIVAYLDHPKEFSIDKPFIIMAPSYGETKRQSLTLSYNLVSNGFNVLRYDGTNQIGESDGEMMDFTLPGAEDDLLTSCNFLAAQYGVKEIGIVATSLAARVAIKAATRLKNIKMVVCIAGIVNLRDTLAEVYHEDMIGTCMDGRKWPITDVLGFEVKGQFLETAIEGNYHDLQSTIKDIEQLNIPVTFILGEKDVWVDPQHVRQVVKASRHGESNYYLIQQGMHQLYENPNAARSAMKLAILNCVRTMCNHDRPESDIYTASMKVLARQSRIEKERQVKRQFLEEEERKFWEKYLSKYVVMEKSNDYRLYLKTVAEMMGEVHEGAVVLDVGCGPGYFGAWLLRQMMRHYLINAPCVYIGVDFVGSALQTAINKYQELLSVSRRDETDADSANIMNHFYVLEDVTSLTGVKGNRRPIHFREKSFDKLLCSLFLSYVEDPDTILERLFGLLKENGRIVVSSLKPYCDLSQIYRNFLDEVDGVEEIEEARKLLSAAGKIKLKEMNGQYKFFTAQELILLLKKIGGKNISHQHSLAGQVILAAAEK